MAKTILIVDDSASMRQLIEFAVKTAGYATMTAGTGAEALEKLKNGTADLVITDLNMPEMDGLSLIREIRALSAHKFVPILMLTTEAQAAKREEGRAAGASGWIVKPFSSERLLEIVKKFLRE